MFGNKSVAPKTIGTLIGSGTTVEGNLSYTGGLRIDGTVKGNVRCCQRATHAWWSSAN